jgi:urease alpha subunit
LSDSRDADIAQRAKFYNEPGIARMISKNGVPKSRKAIEIIVSESTEVKSGASAITQKLIDCMNFVTFIVHPQQINIRDKANGKIIAVIAR